MSDFILALDAEIEELERQLSCQPLYVKLLRARELRDAYMAADAPPQPRPHRATRPLASGSGIVVVAAVRKYLAGKTQPTTTRELMDVLSAEGIAVRGSVPQNSVSSMLSRSSDIISHGRAGWTLAAMEKAGDDAPSKDASPAFSQLPSTPVEPGEEVAHDNTLELRR